MADHKSEDPPVQNVLSGGTVDYSINVPLYHLWKAVQRLR